MPSISSIMNHEHNNILYVVDALEKNAEGLLDGEPLDTEFYMMFVDFQKLYTDLYHHIKEEEIFFPVLEQHESTKNIPEIKILVHQHILSRAHVKNIEDAIASENIRKIVTNALDYGKMIRDHIRREDEEYFPLIEKVLPKEVKSEITTAFIDSESKHSKELKDKLASLNMYFKRFSEKVNL